MNWLISPDRRDGKDGPERHAVDHNAAVSLQVGPGRDHIILVADIPFQRTQVQVIPQGIMVERIWFHPQDHVQLRPIGDFEVLKAQEIAAIRVLVDECVAFALVKIIRAVKVAICYQDGLLDYGCGRFWPGVPPMAFQRSLLQAAGLL